MLYYKSFLGLFFSGLVVSLVVTRNEMILFVLVFENDVDFILNAHARYFKYYLQQETSFDENGFKYACLSLGQMRSSEVFISRTSSLFSYNFIKRNQ
jgi:hypothetical protein